MQRLPVPAVLTMLALVVAIVSLMWWNSRRDQPVLPIDATTDTSITPPAPGVDAPPVTGPRLPAMQPGGPEDVEAQRAASRESAREVVEAGRDKLQNRYASERVDGAWALAKEQALVKLSSSPQIDGLGARPAGLKATCRSSVCRLEADFKSPGAASDWFTLYTMNVGQEMPNVSLQQTTNPDGSVHVELYGLARP